MPFTQYALWLGDPARAAERAADEAYWVERFAGGDVPTLELPTDRPRPALKTYASRREDRVLGEDLVRALKRTGAKERASLFAVLLAPIIARLLAMAVSRGREYLADASGAELTRHPLALASALETIEDAVEPTRRIKQGSAHLCICDPLGRHVDDLEGWLADLFASHPPMAKRIKALKQMSYT